MAKKDQIKGFEETINNIPLVVDPCKMCKIYKKHNGWFMGEFKKGEWEDSFCCGSDYLYLGNKGKELIIKSQKFLKEIEK